MAVCDKCAEPVESADKFCRSCGNPLSPAPVAQPKAEERRLLTVLFCDLVGSTELASRLDPEETHELIQLYQAACGQEITRFGGYTAQYLGDGILVYFGYPAATDDSAEQAVRCALAMRQSIERLSTELESTWGVTLAVRIGVHSGLVVIGDMGSGERTERLALGETPNIAARIQAEADRNEVVISSDTRKLTQGRFALTDRGAPPLKGVSQPLSLYAVHHQATNLLRAGGHAAHVPIRGRDSELAELDEVLESVESGGVQRVLIRGEAGSGKSHLLGAFLAAQSLPVIELYCSEHYNNTPFWPLSSWLEQRLGVQGQPLAKREAALVRFLDEQSLPPSLLPGLSALLGLAGGDADASALRQATLTSMREVLCARSIIIVLENRQWADASTLEFMDGLAAAETSSTVLVLQTARPVSVRETGDDSLRVIELGPIDYAAAEQIVTDTVGDSFDADERRLIIERASGLPMFIAELARQREVAGSGVPTSLHSLLLNQLERIQDAKRVAQEAAVLGAEFRRDELRSISLFDDAHFEDRLDTLQRAQVVSMSSSPTGTGFRFMHTLMQEVALDSLLRKSRTQIHRRIALHLQEQNHTSEPDRQLCSRLARHWVNAVADRTADTADIVIAVKHLQLSVELSLAIAAYEEASHSLDLIQGLLTRIGDGQLRDELQLKLCMTKCVVYCARAEYASPQVESEVRAAESLCRTLGRRREHAQILLNLWMMHISRGNYPDSLAVAEESLAIAKAEGDDIIRVRALAAFSNSQFWLGNLDSAYASACEAIDAYRPGSDPKGVVEHGWDAGIQAYMVATWAAWLLGRTDTLETLGRMKALTAELDHPFNQMLYANTAAVLHAMRGDGQAAVASNAQQVRVANTFNLAFYRMLGAMFHGFATALLDQGDEGFVAADKSFQYYEAKLAGLGQSFIAAAMVVVYAAQGQHARAAAVADYGLAACARSQEGVFVATLQRQQRLLAGATLPPIEALLICGKGTDDNTALDPDDERNVWIGQSGSGVEGSSDCAESAH